MAQEKEKEAIIDGNGNENLASVVPTTTPGVNGLVVVNPDGSNI